MAKISEWETHIKTLVNDELKLYEIALTILNKWDMFKQEFEGLDAIKIILETEAETRRIKTEQKEATVYY